jgi:exodeoxyribonuclease (lambda-induced)
MAETQQRTDEWFQARRGKLTASNLGALLGLVKWTSRQQAYERVTGEEARARKPENWSDNRACEWGITHERDGVMAYMTKTGNLVNMTGLHVHKHIPWIAGSPDGFVGNEGLIEVKCPYWPKKDGSPRLHSTVPIYYYLQMNALLEITEREWCDYVCWVPNEGTAVFRVSRDKETWDFLMNYYSTIYAAVQSGLKHVPQLPKSERDKIEARIHEAMKSKVDLTFWKAQINTRPPEPEECDIERRVDDGHVLKPDGWVARKRAPESDLVSSRTRHKCAVDAAAKELLSFRYQKDTLSDLHVK